MALNKANITWSAKQIAKMMAQGKFTFDNIIQRSYVWETARKSNLIHSMIEGYPIPPFFARKIDGKIYDFLDGKQRMNAIYGFLNNEYALTGITEEIEYVDAEGNTISRQVSGDKFDDLPEELQDAIKDYSLTIYYYEDITPEQVRILFAKLNNGKPLTTKEKNIVYCADIETVANIGNHVFFMETLTDRAKETKKQLPIVMKIYEMLTDDIVDVSFASKDFNLIMQDTILEEEDKENVIAVLDKFHSIYQAIGEKYSVASVAKEVRRKMATEMHMVSLVPFVKEAVDKEIDDAIMADFMYEIFYKKLVSDEYAEACQSGSAKNASIMKRHEELCKAWDKFFEVDDEENEE